ncbi:hypothetical protein MOQ72_34270 [Saccharopolyspora sp. K220]|uniref:hypothetical protein n=1 Tax=Saccharopolyspora soli TaxID=2926618 RepID=UPI001F5A5C7B|nr:hypothetical protein [Saccharopolyspora soli]MCI2422506.1 hypothetical protein [Saccharopolyspora soli]
MAAELWTSTQVAAHLGLKDHDSAGRTLRAWGVHPVARQPGRGGQNLYDAAVVRAAKTARPGQGYRSDLRKRASMQSGFGVNRQRVDQLKPR